MKKDNEKMAVYARHKGILRVLYGRGLVSIKELAKYFGVTPRTITRDIQMIVEQAKINIISQSGPGGGVQMMGRFTYMEQKQLDAIKRAIERADIDDVEILQGIFDSCILKM